MTEADWLDGEDPEALLGFLLERGAISPRKQRLFAAACCREVWPLISPANRAYLAVAERLADALAGERERKAARAAAFTAERWVADERWRRGAGTVKESVEMALARRSEDAARYTKNRVRFAVAVFRWPADVPWPVQRDDPAWARYHELLHEIEKSQCGILRDLVGNPFREAPVTEPRWLEHDEGAVRRLAAQIYDEHAFGRLEELSALLERAGCRDDDVLGHCRSEEPHDRGCWVIDLLTGRT